MSTVEAPAAVLSPQDYSVVGNERAERFALFAAAFLRGHILDVGCGAAAVPVYLQSRMHAPQTITGIDPIPAEHPFTFRQAMAEQLPFVPNRFDTVVCATTLDHLAHPSHVPLALREIRRVLKPGGRFVSWETTVPLGDDGADAQHQFRFTNDWLFHRFADFFRPVVMEWHHAGMRKGCAEVFGVWEKDT